MYKQIDPESFPAYTVEMMEQVGHAFMEGTLDFKKQNPFSRIERSRYKTIDAIKSELATLFELNDIPGVVPIPKEKLPLSCFLYNKKKGKKGKKKGKENEKGKGKKGKKKGKKSKKATFKKGLKKRGGSSFEPVLVLSQQDKNRMGECEMIMELKQ